MIHLTKRPHSKSFTKAIFMLLFTSVAFISNAQFVTNGDGTAYTFAQLANETDQISISGNNAMLNGLITLTATDSFIVNTVDTLFFAADGELRIEGTMLAQTAATIVFTAIDSTLGYEGITFDESTGSIIENVHFQYGGGVKLLYSDVQFRNCQFYKTTEVNGSGAIEMLGSNPVISKCRFIKNKRSAIASSATAASSPQILNCYLYRNNTENGNRPQINLGTSDGENNIIISGNTIDGYYDEAGGISLATLAGGSVSAIVENNTIVNNRYGLNVQGNVTVDIIGNRLIDNNIEDNPMAGGSGISFYSGAQATVAHNIITGNLWGITIPSEANPNFGQLGSDTVNIGHNYIYNNSNGGTVYNLYNNSPAQIYAQNNYWGTTSTTEAAQWIVDNADNSALGEVIYEPIYLLNSDKAFDEFYVQNGDENIFGNIDATANAIALDVPMDYQITEVTPYFTVSKYATVLVDDVQQTSGQDTLDFTNSIVYTIVAEDSTETQYTVTIEPAVSINNVENNTFTLHPNPTTNRLHIKSLHNAAWVTIRDTNGKIILSQASKSIDVAHLQQGIYFAEIHFDNGNISIQKFIKE